MNERMHEQMNVDDALPSWIYTFPKVSSLSEPIPEGHSFSCPWTCLTVYLKSFELKHDQVLKEKTDLLNLSCEAIEQSLPNALLSPGTFSGNAIYSLCLFIPCLTMNTVQGGGEWEFLESISTTQLEYFSMYSK